MSKRKLIVCFMITLFLGIVSNQTAVSADANFGGDLLKPRAKVSQQKDHEFGYFDTLGTTLAGRGNITDYIDWKMTGQYDQSYEADIFLFSKSKKSSDKGYVTDLDLNSLQGTVDDKSPLKADDVKINLVNDVTPHLHVTVYSPEGRTKVQGPGSTLILNLSDANNKKQQIKIGLWINYNANEFVEVDSGNNFSMHFMFNKFDSQIPTNDVDVTRVLPNWNYVDYSQNKKRINSLYRDNTTVPDDNDLGSGNTSHLNLGTDSLALNQGFFKRTDVLKGAQMDANDAHFLLIKDPNEPFRLLCSYDWTGVVEPAQNGRPPKTGKFRIQMIMRPFAIESVLVKTRIINLSTNSDFDNGGVWMYQNYDVNINGDSQLPLYISDILDNGFPRGFYFEGSNNPYRFNFDFSDKNGPLGFNGSNYNYMGVATPFGSGVRNLRQPTDVNLLADSTNAEVGALWQSNQMGALPYGQPSNSMAFHVDMATAAAPRLIIDLTDAQKYIDGPDGSYKPLPIKGKVATHNGGKVGIYYTIDENVNFKNLNGTKLCDVDLGDSSKLISFNSQITNKSDLEKIAKDSVNGHIIYLYAMDSNQMTSNVEKVESVPNNVTTINYRDLNTGDILDTKSVRGPKGDSYDPKPYLKSAINVGGKIYQFSPADSDTLSGIYGDHEVNLYYYNYKDAVQKEKTLEKVNGKFAQVGDNKIITSYSLDNAANIARVKLEQLTGDKSGFQLNTKEKAVLKFMYTDDSGAKQEVILAGGNNQPDFAYGQEYICPPSSGKQNQAQIVLEQPVTVAGASFVQDPPDQLSVWYDKQSPMHTLSPTNALKVALAKNVTLVVPEKINFDNIGINDIIKDPTSFNGDLQLNNPEEISQKVKASASLQTSSDLLRNSLYYSHQGNFVSLNGGIWYDGEISSNTTIDFPILRTKPNVSGILLDFGTNKFPLDYLGKHNEISIVWTLSNSL